MLELSEYAQQPIEEIHLQINKNVRYVQPHPFGDVQLTKAGAEFLAPLFEAQGWKTSISDAVPDGFIDLDKFRQMRMNFGATDIRLWSYSLTSYLLPMDLQRQTIFVHPSSALNGKFILVKTSRYCNVFIDYMELKKYAKDIVMIGLEEEHKAFCADYFDVDFYRVKDALEAAQLIAGSNGIIANQCGLYAIAEMMKAPRVLLTAEAIEVKDPNTDNMLLTPGPANVIAQGGQVYLVQTQKKFEAVTRRLFEK